MWIDDQMDPVPHGKREQSGPMTSPADSMEARVAADVARHYATNRDARWKQDADDRQQLANERAREFWERMFVQYSSLPQYEGADCCGQDADDAVTEWRKRFAPTHPASIAQAAAESCANPSAWLLLGEAVDIINSMWNAVSGIGSPDPEWHRLTDRASRFCAEHFQALEDWRKSR